MMAKMISTFVFLFASFSLAGPMPSGYEWGNGGFFVSCTQDSVLGQGVFSVDRVEGMFLHKFQTSDLVRNLDSEDLIVEEVFHRLRMVNPVRAVVSIGFLFIQKASSFYQ